MMYVGLARFFHVLLVPLHLGGGSMLFPSRFFSISFSPSLFTDFVCVFPSMVEEKRDGSRAGSWQTRPTMGDPVTCFLSKLGNARLMYSTGPFY
jgi:hypothetical protein